MGACSSCAGLLRFGSVTQDDGSFLTEEEKQKGFVLLCSAFPKENCTIVTHAEELLTTDIEHIVGMNEAVMHYLFGGGSPVTLDISEIIGVLPNLEFVSQIRRNYKYLGAGIYEIEIPVAFQTTGQFSAYLGYITLEYVGILRVNSDLSYEFNGDVLSRNDFYNFNISPHRDVISQASTILGRSLGFIFEGMEYDVIISGSLPVSLSGTLK